MTVAQLIELLQTMPWLLCSDTLRDMGTMIMEDGAAEQSSMTVTS